MYSIPQNVLKEPIYFIHDECVLNPHLIHVEDKNHNTLYDKLIHIKNANKKTNKTVLEEFLLKPTIEKNILNNLHYINKLLDTESKTIITIVPNRFNRIISGSILGRYKYLW